MPTADQFLYPLMMSYLEPSKEVEPEPLCQLCHEQPALFLCRLCEEKLHPFLRSQYQRYQEAIIQNELRIYQLINRLK
jgi:hypothetical protein